MRIKSLSIKGFKTFYEKSIIEFDSKISAIVGPNGCGKTNILDALRWVLGEQNPRILRSDSMSQIISDGNDNLPKHNFAEVSLLIDGHHKDFAEMEIKRRLYRTGESEYYLNNQQCRLKDITDTVMSFGVGSRSFTVIPQGQIETYITARPEEKRQLIDDVAGLAKYKTRRAETERKILLIKDNLEKTKYVQSEIEQQKDLLQEQAKKADEYTNLVNQFKNLETLFYKKRYKDLSSKLISAQNEKSLFQETLDEVKREKKEIKNDIETSTVSQVKLKKDLDNLNSNLLDNKQEELKLISNNKTLEIETNLLIEELERSKSNNYELKEELSSLEIEIKDIKENYDSNDLDMSIKNQLELEAIKKKCLSNKKEETDKLEVIRDNLQTINKKYLELNAEIKATESRMMLLENIESTYGWLPEGIRNFVQNLKGKDVDGILSDYIRPKDGYEKAVESALGEKLKWILISDHGDTIATIKEFKENCTGKGTFISLDNRKVAGASTNLNCKTIMDCIDCDQQNRPFLASIFGDTYIVDNVADALMERRNNPGCNFVTTDGEFFDSNGSITVGSAPDSILQIKDEIRNLSNQKSIYEKEIDLITLDIKRTEEEIFDINNRIASFDSEIEAAGIYQSAGIGKINDKIIKIKDKIRIVTSRIIKLEDKIESNTNKLNIVGNDLPISKENEDKIKDKIDRLKIEIGNNESEIQRLNEVVLSKDEMIDQKRVESINFDSNIQKIQLEIDQLLENSNLGSEDRDISSITNEEEQKMAEFQREGSLSKSKFYKLQKSIDDFGPVNLLAPDEYSRLEDRYNFINNQVNDLYTSLNNLEKTMKKIDEESETTFIETFNKISNKYDESIKRLFGGGEGKLILTNPDSIKDSGVEVMLKIGLKRYRTLKSYSGGERALAGIALLLSAYFVKPAPFLLLDEVDAPLDDKNISKFGEMLEEISKESQIAIITHNKGTMRYGSKLIGVTSKLEGISEVVPVDLPG